MMLAGFTYILFLLNFFKILALFPSYSYLRKHNLLRLNVLQYCTIIMANPKGIHSHNKIMIILEYLNGCTDLISEVLPSISQRNKSEQ